MSHNVMEIVNNIIKNNPHFVCWDWFNVHGVRHLGFMRFPYRKIMSQSVSLYDIEGNYIGDKWTP